MQTRVFLLKMTCANAGALPTEEDLRRDGVMNMRLKTPSI